MRSHSLSPQVYLSTGGGGGKDLGPWGSCLKEGKGSVVPNGQVEVRLKGIRQDCSYCQLDCSPTGGIFSQAIPGCWGKSRPTEACPAWNGWSLECGGSHLQPCPSDFRRGRDCKIYRQLSADRKCNLFHWSLSICIAHFRMILTKELLPYFEVRFPKSQEQLFKNNLSQSYSVSSHVMSLEKQLHRLPWSPLVGCLLSQVREVLSRTSLHPKYPLGGALLIFCCCCYCSYFSCSA